MKTGKISELITALHTLQSEVGDVPIVCSGDPEGNSYGTIDTDQCVTFEDGVAILWPSSQFIDFDDEEYEEEEEEWDGNDIEDEAF